MNICEFKKDDYGFNHAKIDFLEKKIKENAPHGFDKPIYASVHKAEMDQRSKFCFDVFDSLCDEYFIVNVKGQDALDLGHLGAIVSIGFYYIIGNMK